MAAGPGWLGLAYWLVIFAIICALLFLAMYCLFKLTDLEEDALNPYDASKQLNDGAWIPPRPAPAPRSVLSAGRLTSAAVSLPRSGEARVLPAGHAR